MGKDSLLLGIFYLYIYIIPENKTVILSCYATIIFKTLPIITTF